MYEMLGTRETIDFAAGELERCLGSYSNAPAVELAVDSELGPQEYTIDGDGRKYCISGGSPVGALYGAYGLLKKLGFRWFSPDEWDEEVPESINPVELHLRESPSFGLRGFFGVEKRDSREFILWMIRNRMNLWTGATNCPELCSLGGFSLRGNPPGGSHRICSDFLPSEKYFALHPEWYALVNGSRRANMPEDNVSDNICFSNEEACRVLAENIAEALNEGPLADTNILALWPFDNGVWCECDECAALGNKTSQFLHFVHICSKTVSRLVRRRITLVVPAYHETLPIPSRPLPDDFDYDSVLVEFFPIERCYAHDIDDPRCAGNMELVLRLRQWCDNTRFRVMLCEYYNVSTFASMAFPLAGGMGHDVSFYRSCGIDAMNYMHVSTALWGELAFNNWTFAEKLWNANADTSDFFEKRYHAHARTMKRFYDILGTASGNCKLLKHYQGMKVSDTGKLENFCTWRRLCNLEYNGPFFPDSHFNYDRDEDGAPSLLTTLHLMDEAKNVLKEAIRSCSDEIVNQRLMMDMCRFSYTHDIVRFIEALARLRLAEASGDDALQAAKDLNWFGERLRQERTMQANIRAQGAPNLRMYTNGLTATMCQDAYARLMQKYGLPVAPWEPGELMQVFQG